MDHMAGHKPRFGLFPKIPLPINIPNGEKDGSDEEPDDDDY